MPILISTSATGAADNAQEDIDFFKTCIVDFYCFKKHPTEHMWTGFPNFKDLIGTPYFDAMAKRVQLFFIRYNTWSNTLVDAKFRDVASGISDDLAVIHTRKNPQVVTNLKKQIPKNKDIL